MAVIRPFREHQPKFAADVFLAESCSVLGDVELAEEVSIWYGAVLRGDVGRIRIGARTNIQDNVSIHMTHEVSDAILGCDVIVGHNAVVHGAIVEDHALIGMNSVVMDNARVGEGAWVAAGSIVAPGTVLKPNTIYRGSPARPFRDVKDQEREWARDAIQRYVELAREHKRAQLSAGVQLP